MTILDDLLVLRDEFLAWLDPQSSDTKALQLLVYTEDEQIKSFYIGPPKSETGSELDHLPPKLTRTAKKVKEFCTEAGKLLPEALKAIKPIPNYYDQVCATDKPWIRWAQYLHLGLNKLQVVREDNHFQCVYKPMDFLVTPIDDLCARIDPNDDRVKTRTSVHTIPLQFQSEKMSKKKFAKRLRPDMETKPAVAYLTQKMDEGKISYKKITRQSYIFDLRQLES